MTSSVETLWRSARHGVGAALGIRTPVTGADDRALSGLLGLIAILAGPLVTASAATHELIYNASPWPIWALAYALALALLARRRAPMTAFLLCLAIVLVLSALGVDSVADFGLLLALYSVAAHRDIRIALAAAVLLEVGVIVAALRFAPAGSIDDAVVFLTGLGLGALFLGTTFRANRRYTAEVEDRARRLEREKEQETQLAAAAERTRIAREMHDIVAHGLAVVVTLSEGAASAVDRDPDAARSAMAAAASAGRESLAETRRLLRVLRTEPADREPNPDLSQLDRLLDTVRRTGRSADLELDPALLDAGTALQATLFRIVQEAITNVLKHAPESTSVSVAVTGDAHVILEVRDDGGSHPVGATSDGTGLVGMRERVAAFDGALTAGPVSGGWLVRARIPSS